MFTTNALPRAILSGRPLEQIAVGELSKCALLSVRPSDSRTASAAAVRAAFSSPPCS